MEGNLDVIDKGVQCQEANRNQEYEDILALIAEKK